MKTLIAVPVFNEQKYVARVLDRILSHAPNVLVVDDGSTDGTSAILVGRRDITVHTHPQNLGYGESIIDAFDYAARHHYDWVITMDCDEQHEPERIVDFLAAIAADDADIISGSRYLRQDWGTSAVPPDRRTINQIVTAMIERHLGLSLTDSFCGFKAHRVTAMEKLHLTVRGYAFPMQFWVQAKRAGLRIVELPVDLIYNDPTRHFGGLLDNPDARLRHYQDVFFAELKLGATLPMAAAR